MNAMLKGTLGAGRDPPEVLGEAESSDQQKGGHEGAKERAAWDHVP